AYYARRRREPPAQDLYNALQRLAYTSVIVIAVIEVLSGIAIYKPVQLWWLAGAFGGYDAARAVHLLGLVALVLFTIGHIIMVASHTRSLAEMVTGARAAVTEPVAPTPTEPAAASPPPAPAGPAPA